MVVVVVVVVVIYAGKMTRLRLDYATLRHVTYNIGGGLTNLGNARSERYAIAPVGRRYFVPLDADLR